MVWPPSTSSSRSRTLSALPPLDLYSPRANSRRQAGHVRRGPRTRSPDGQRRRQAASRSRTGGPRNRSPPVLLDGAMEAWTERRGGREEGTEPQRHWRSWRRRRESDYASVGAVSLMYTAVSVNGGTRLRGGWTKQLITLSVTFLNQVALHLCQPNTSNTAVRNNLALIAAIKKH